MMVACWRDSVRLLAVSGSALLVLIAILVGGPGGTLQAHAQAPAGIDQYLPEDEGGGGGGAPDVDRAGGIPGSGDGPSTDAGRGGELPFTGYPLTPLLLILLALLTTGLSARAYLAIRERARARNAASGVE